MNIRPQLLLLQLPLYCLQEIGLLFNTLRTATVESATPMELLVIGKEDFIRIFMKADNPDDEPDHIKFLRCVL